MIATPSESNHTPPAARRDQWSRRRDVALAGHLGDVERARAGLADADAAVRATAIGAAERAGALTAADVAAALADPAPAVRRRSALAAVPFVSVGDPVVRLAPLLDDEDASVVEVAAFACGECDPPETGVPERLACLAVDHDDPLVRESAVAALGSLADQRGLAAILAATTDKPAIRRRAALALAPFEGPEVDAALTRLLEDRDWQVRQAAEDLLGGLADQAE